MVQTATSYVKQEAPVEAAARRWRREGRRRPTQTRPPPTDRHGHHHPADTTGVNPSVRADARRKTQASSRQKTRGPLRQVQAIERERQTQRAHCELTQSRLWTLTSYREDVAESRVGEYRREGASTCGLNKRNRDAYVFVDPCGDRHPHLPRSTPFTRSARGRDVKRLSEAPPWPSMTAPVTGPLWAPARRSPAANGGCRERAAGRHPQCGSPSAHAGPTTRRGRPRRRPLAAAVAASRPVAAAVPREGRAAAVGGRRSAQPPRASLTRGPEWPRWLTTGKEDSKQCHREMKKATTKIQAAPHLVEMRIYNQRTRGGQ